MKYAHLADLHLGSWREPKMRELSTTAFLKAIEMCVEHKVDFILFAGDIFNTSLPSLDTLKIVTKKLKELQDLQIPLYVIAGSHDFSPSGKTMIDVLENAGLLSNVCKGKVNPDTKQLHLDFTIEPKTGAKITGILGRKGQLDRTYYQNLHLPSLEEESGYKIFMFHTTLSELKPKHLEKVESHPASFLPKGFNYYAGGHIHHKNRVDLPNYGPMTYPGALFPNNFAEVEKYSHGGFYLIEDQNISWQPLNVIEHTKITIDCNGKTPDAIQTEIQKAFEQDIAGHLVTLRLHGLIENGKVSDIDFKHLFSKAQENNAFIVLKNTAKLTTAEFEEIKTSAGSPEEIEDKLIHEHLGQISLFPKDTEISLTKQLLQALHTTKKEGETVNDFHSRILSEIQRILA